MIHVIRLMRTIIWDRNNKIQFYELALPHPPQKYLTPKVKEASGYYTITNIEIRKVI